MYGLTVNVKILKLRNIGVNNSLLFYTTYYYTLMLNILFSIIEFKFCEKV